VPLAPRRVPTVAPEPAPVTPPSPAKADHAFVGVLAALASLLAARLLLLLAVTFGFVLAVMAVRTDSYLGLALVGTFCGLTVLPLVWLDIVTHRRGGQ
jgi:hypothetical protein